MVSSSKRSVYISTGIGEGGDRQLSMKELRSRLYNVRLVVVGGYDHAIGFFRIDAYSPNGRHGCSSSNHIIRLPCSRIPF